MQVRCIVFTWNNWDDSTIAKLRNLGTSYCCYGKETGENGTKHLQGYAEYDFSKKIGSLYKKWNGAHIEPRRGSQAEAIAYTKKEADWTEFGTKKAAGHRTDIERVRLQAINGGMRSIVGTASPQQIQAAEKCLKYLEEPRDWRPEILWVWGPTGTGKSRYARECLNDYYTKNEGSKWWEGYDGHEDVIIDDFRDSWWSLTELLSLTDRYEKRVECKNGTRQFRPRRIIITSCKAPEDCYKGCGEDIGQLLRRLDDVLFLGAKDAEVQEVILGALELDI